MNSAERRAVAFFAALAAAGAAARALGLGDPPGARAPTAEDRLALQRQLEAVDSAHARKEARRGGNATRGRRGRKAPGPEAGAVEAETAGPAIARRSRGRPSRASAASTIAAARGPVDVNHADTAELATLPGVGPALARRIVVDRAERGGYGSMAELSRVRGIGAALEARLAGAVTFIPGGRPSSGSAMAGGPSARVPAAGATRVPPVRWPAP